ncbi:Ribokinase-like protein [Amylostereum chailletii]|nr:Ribokinase-like protein [Amylostereum chailletii]
MPGPGPRAFATLGMFIIGGGGTYANLGARIWLPPHALGMLVDVGPDFDPAMRRALDAYGPAMWLFRPRTDGAGTTRARNAYVGDRRGFEYLTPRIRLTPRDLAPTPLAAPRHLHFICSPARAAAIVAELRALAWAPTTVFEPIPDRCVPEELPALVAVLPSIHILSPNAEEALSLLSLPLPATRPAIESACATFLALGVGPAGSGSVIIRSGAMGAYVASRARAGVWVDAFWGDKDAARVVDVTGAGNAFLGGLVAGLVETEGDVSQAVLYGTVSASYTIEQKGLPRLTRAAPAADDAADEEWNGDSPRARLEALRARVGGQ